MVEIDPHAVAIGAAVRGAIAQAGLTQVEVSERTPMALNTLSRRINGLLPFTWPELVAISKLTDVSLVDLVSTAERLALRQSAA